MTALIVLGCAIGGALLGGTVGVVVAPDGGDFNFEALFYGFGGAFVGALIGATVGAAVFA